MVIIKKWLSELPRQALFIIPACWLLLIIGPAIWGMGPLFFHGLFGPDDYMRMVQVFDFLKHPFGSSFEQPRLGLAGSHNLLHWSRLPDLPLALVVFVFTPLVGKIQAAWIAATIVPAFYTFILLVATYWYAGLFTDKKRAVASAVILCLTWPMLRQFMPGRVDHHNLVLLSTLIGYCCLISAFRFPGKTIYPVLAGVSFGTGLTIAVEILPWIGLAAAFGAWI